MVRCEFIDLLSSDEEAVPAPCAQKPVVKSTPPRSRHSPKSQFLDFSDHVESTVPLDEGYTSNPAKKRKLNSSLKQTKNETSWTDDGFAVLQDEDPVTFISPVHQYAIALESHWRANRVDDRDVLSDKSYDSLPEDILDLPRQTINRKLDENDLSSAKAAVTSGFSRGSCALSDTTTVVLAGLTNSRKNERQNSEALIRTTSIASGGGTLLKAVSRTHTVLDVSEKEETDQMTSSRQESRHQLTKEEKAQRANEKEREKEAKTLDKQRAKERKAKEKEEDLQRRRLEKEKKAKQKQKDAEIAEVNKAKLDKKDSTPEMIVDLPASIHGHQLDTQTREFLKNLDVEASLYQSSIPNVIKWRRKVKAKWNSEEGLWEPLPRMQIEDEKHVICIMPAEEFISLATAQNVEGDLDTHVAKLRNAHFNCVLIYLIEGLTKRMRESKTAANRKYQNEVLKQSQTETTSNSQSNKRKKAAATPIIISEDVIEDALLRLQVMNDCLIHHTAFNVETAEWIATFTQHISTIPYKNIRMNLTTTSSFCMDPGQVKAGLDKPDTYAKMLQEVVRVTPPIAHAIADKYPSVISLVRAFRADGPLVLQHLRKAANRNGALSERCVGKALSRRLYGIFMESDAASVRV